MRSRRGATKSECIGFVHSCSDVGLLLGDEAVDSGCDFRGIIDAGQLVQPWPVFLEVPCASADQVASALACGVPCAFIVHIAKSPRTRVRSGTIRWQPPALKSGVLVQPRRDRFGLLHTVVIHHDRETRHPGLWVRVVQHGQEITNECMGFTGTEAREQLVCGEVESASQRLFCLLPWRHDFL
jgi:hypothetical protein